MKDNNGFFCQTYTIDYRSIRPDFRLSFSKLMEFMQETSIRHTDSTIFPMQWFYDNKKGFLLTNWQVSINKYLRLHDEIKIMTAPIMFKGILAERYFEATDDMGEIIATACSKWSFTDLSKRRPVKTPQGVWESYGKWIPTPSERDYELPMSEDKVKIDEDHFKPQRRDIDSNIHVNNLAYLDWAMNYIPDEIYGIRDVAEMKAHYKHECMFGDVVFAETWTCGDCGFITAFYHAENKYLLAEVYTKWI